MVGFRVERSSRREIIGGSFSRRVSISDFFVSRPREKRTESWAISGSEVIAMMTWEGAISPEAQAEPVETAIFSRSR